ncbi:hypothetical protein BSKO_04313 [Bryopsis sp. KO-2023]|nr:hypothetical protein BSKO_04313 [Bryopsis sp. KO-2023]
MKDDISKSLKDLNLTSEEVKKFDKAFKDPKFVELFDDYLAEISTPQAKEEQELYLRQLENQGKSESVYGKGVQLLVPEPGCVVKTKDKRTGEKVFINICTSDKVPPTSWKTYKKYGNRLKIAVLVDPTPVGPVAPSFPNTENMRIPYRSSVI